MARPRGPAERGGRPAGCGDPPGARVRDRRRGPRRGRRRLRGGRTAARPRRAAHGRLLRFTWRRGFVDEAWFALTGRTPSGRRELLERLLADHPHAAAVDLTDPERWEGALIDALLSHPVTHRLRTLDLRLTDYHHSAEHAARSLAGHPRPRLEHLRFGYGFEYLYEDGETSTGGRIDPMDHHHSALVRTAPWEALPALRSLELDGAFLFDAIDHDGLTRLRVNGPATSDGAVFDLGRTPGVASLVVEIGCDVYGASCPVEQLDELTPAGYPGLTHLDLGGSEFDATLFEVFSALAESPVLPGLDSLVLPDLRIGRSDGEGDPAAELVWLAPRFAHLALWVNGAVEVEGVDGQELARLIPGLRPRRADGAPEG
ncbi:hypothetical protein ACIF6L_13230 [Kitasatospora sp. NPDC086009]|uniref:hypothetical protein n=1 Tax=unclassified Kitasatospora TaxID=2633591 RepID=UPI0037C76A7B